MLTDAQACKPPRRERGTCVLKQHSPNGGATKKGFRQHKVSLE